MAAADALVASDADLADFPSLGRRKERVRSPAADDDVAEVPCRRTASPRRGNGHSVDDVVMRSRNARPEWSEMCGEYSRSGRYTSVGEGAPVAHADAAEAELWGSGRLAESVAASPLCRWFLQAYRGELASASGDGGVAVAAALDAEVLRRFSLVAARALRVAGRAPRLLYHGTKERHVRCIMAQGLRTPERGHYTPYIWSSPHAGVSAGYSDYGEIFACAAVDLSGLPAATVRQIIPPPPAPAKPPRRVRRGHRDRRRPEAARADDASGGGGGGGGGRGAVCTDMGWAVVFGRADMLCPLARVPVPRRDDFGRRVTSAHRAVVVTLSNPNPRGPAGAEATLRAVAAATPLWGQRAAAVVLRAVARDRTRDRAWERRDKLESAGVFAAAA